MLHSLNKQTLKSFCGQTRSYLTFRSIIRLPFKLSCIYCYYVDGLFKTIIDSVIVFGCLKSINNRQMGNSIEQKQNRTIENGYYFIKPSQNTYLSHNYSIVSEPSSDCLFYIQKIQSQKKGSGQYYIKLKENEMWFSPEYDWKKHDKFWSLSRNIEWHFFQHKPDQFIICTQKISSTFPSEYQELSLLDDKTKGKRAILKKLDYNEKKCINQNWALKKVYDIGLYQSKENNSEIMCSLSEKFSLQRMKSTEYQINRLTGKSHLKEIQKDKAFRLTKAI